MKITAKSIEEKLLEEGLVTAEALSQARAEAPRVGQSVRQILVRSGSLDPQSLAHWLSQQLGIPRVDLKNYLIDSQVLEALPEVLARKHHVIPILKIGSTLTVATADPLNLTALDEIRLKTGLNVEVMISIDSEILQALEEYYGAKGRLEELVADLTQEKLGLRPGENLGPKRLEGLVTEAPIVRMVNLLLADAIHARASDIHLEAEREGMRVRFRVDGMLKEFAVLPKHLEAAVVSRVKILSSLDIAERRKPQDGRFRISMEGHEVDLRVSVLPAIDGETVVLRLLDTAGLKLSLEQLGMNPQILTHYEKLIQRPWGIVLVTGPTGSGKTTTLYASLSILNAVERNIITVEDPVEYRLKGVRQVAVNPGVNLTFATGLRSILRQDPDVIMVGEIRDPETAGIAIQAALTGHLVFSTLHTNDAPSSITRLLDMGVEPFLISSALLGVLAQRLIRVICPDCKSADSTQAEVVKRLGMTENGSWFRGKGCRKCHQTGFKGRIGIYEMMVMDGELDRMVVAKATANAIRDYALSHGMKTLREDGMTKVTSGVTTIDEILRVTEER